MSANTSQYTDRATQSPPSKPRPASGAENLVGAVIALFTVSAVHFDGRVHWLDLPDSFFTTWHAALYGGLTMYIVFLAMLVVRRSRGVGDVSPSFNLLPDGYKTAAVGAGIFVVGGLADMVWHVAFGIEQGIDALLSPSHLILLTGAALMFSGPILAAHRGPDRDLLSMRIAATGAALAVSLVAAFALSYLSGFVSVAPTFAVGHYPEGTAAHLANESRASLGLAGFLVKALVIALPIAFLSISGGVVPGTATIFLTVHATLALLIVNFSTYGAKLVLVVFTAGLLVDLAIQLTQAVIANGRIRASVIAATVSVGLLWSQLVSVAWLSTLRWSVEMNVGVVVLASAIGAAIVWVGSAPRQAESVAR